jgi:hypothetical protein
MNSLVAASAIRCQNTASRSSGLAWATRRRRLGRCGTLDPRSWFITLSNGGRPGILRRPFLDGLHDNPKASRTAKLFPVRHFDRKALQTSINGTVDRADLTVRLLTECQR